jgi:hypothetical protein
MFYFPHLVFKNWEGGKVKGWREDRNELGERNGNRLEG